MKVILDESDIEKFIKEKYPSANSIMMPRKLSITVFLTELPAESVIPVNVKIQPIDRSNEIPQPKPSTPTEVRLSDGSIDANASGLTSLNYGEEPKSGVMVSRRGVLPRYG